MVYVLGATPNHIPLKYRCPIKISNMLWVVMVGFPFYMVAIS